MTCIIMARFGGVLISGADSVGTTDTSYCSLKNPKIFCITGLPDPKSPDLTEDYVFGSCGRPRISQILQFSKWIPSYHESDYGTENPVYEYMCTSFVDCLREILKVKGYLRDMDGTENFDSDTILVSFKGRIFEIESNFQVIEHDKDFVCIGSGASYAIGSMNALMEQFYEDKENFIIDDTRINEGNGNNEDDKDNEGNEGNENNEFSKIEKKLVDIVLKSMYTAQEYSIGVREPFSFIISYYDEELH